MANKSDALLGRVGWGSYGGFEGPVFWGSAKFQMPADPSFEDKVLAVITKSEGGHYNSCNLYDRCALTVGLIQWGELCAPRSVTQMVGLAATLDEATTNAILAEAGLSVARDPSRDHQWAIRHNAAFVYGEAATRAAFLGCSGRAGAWTPAAKGQARRVCASFAALFAEPFAIEAQMSFTRPRLFSFAFGSLRRELFGDGFPREGWDGALRAIALSFAANLPAVALNVFNRVWPSVQGLDVREQCITYARELTFCGVAIYPHRYDAVRPTVEQLFGVDLPDFASELRFWKQSVVAQFSDPKTLQRALLDLGYDLGPAGADGKVGPKTLAAIKAFQTRASLAADGIVGPRTSRALSDALKAIPPPPEAA